MIFGTHHMTVVAAVLLLTFIALAVVQVVGVATVLCADDIEVPAELRVAAQGTAVAGIVIGLGLFVLAGDRLGALLLG
jgi:hypothetical protein